MNPQLITLPDEVIQAILSYLPPLSTLALQQSCHRLANIDNEPLLWKKYCQQSFKWWDRRYAARLQDSSSTDWKEIYARRHRSSRTTRNAINKIITKELDRLESIKMVLEVGYEAKDDLLDMFWNASFSENHLAQKWVVAIH